MKRILWALIWVLATSVFCSAQTILYFPQIADGFQADGIAWFTAIGITNTAAPSTASASGTIVLTQDNGTPFNVRFNDEQGQPVGSGNTFPFQLAGGQTRYFVSTANQALNTGFATVTSNLPVAGGVVFFEVAVSGGGFTRIAEAGVPAATPLTRQTIFAVAGGSNTGVAVANPGANTASITFQLLDKNGVAALPPVTRALAGRNHTAFFISQLFPSLPTGFAGTMQIVSDRPLVTTALLFENTGEFATFPVFPLQ